MPTSTRSRRRWGRRPARGRSERGAGPRRGCSSRTASGFLPKARRSPSLSLPVHGRRRSTRTSLSGPASGGVRRTIDTASERVQDACVAASHGAMLGGLPEDCCGQRTAYRSQEVGARDLEQAAQHGFQDGDEEARVARSAHEPVVVGTPPPTPSSASRTARMGSSATGRR